MTTLSPTGRIMLVHALPVGVELKQLRSDLTMLASYADIPNYKWRIAYLLWLFTQNQAEITEIIGKAVGTAALSRKVKISYKVPGADFADILQRRLQLWCKQDGWVGPKNQVQVGRLVCAFAEHKVDLAVWMAGLKKEVSNG